MDSTTLLAELQPIFRDVLDQPDLVLTRASNSDNVEDWDSLGHINLVSAIEKKFNIRFALGELKDLNDVGDMIDLMLAKLGAQ
jgi:acyl carrier protein